MALRAIALSIPSTTEVKITFSEDVSESISTDNFSIGSLNGAVNDLEILSVNLNGSVITVKTRPQVSGNYYLIKFLDTNEVPFTSTKGQGIPFDSISRDIFFVGIDNVNPFRDRMFEKLPDLVEIENTTLGKVISSQANELYTAQKTIGEVLSNNYLCVDIIDEPRTRSSGATDRMANENAYEIIRVAKTQTDSAPIFEILNYTSSNPLSRSKTLPVYPISLQQVVAEDETIDIASESNSFDGFLLSLKNRNVIKILSVKYIANGDEIDCDGNIGIDYDLEKYKYSIADNSYDQDFSFQFIRLDDNQILLSEFGNIPRPSVLDSFIVTYLYKNNGKYILEDQVEVSRVDESINESVPTNSASFFLDNAPIVNINNQVISLGGVAFRTTENSGIIPSEFSNELVFDSSKLPSKLGEYSINYSTGEVFLVGAETLGEGTGRNNYVSTYYFRREFIRDLDYSIFSQDLVPTPDRELSNNEAEIFIRYEEVFAQGIDYLAKSHIEVMPEFVKNNLSQSFRLRTQNAPITDVFRILNQTTGEVYSSLFHTDTEIAFSGNRSPEIKEVNSEEAKFSRVVDESLIVIGEFIIPTFNTIITSSISNNNITFSPGIPAELLSQNSVDYFIRESSIAGSISEVLDLNINFFGTPDANNLINSVGISATSSSPATGSNIIIGTRGFIVNLDSQGIINKNHDSIGSLMNTSIEFDDVGLFSKEKYFEPVFINPGTIPTTTGGISRGLVDNKGTVFSANLSRLRKVGDYSVDYNNGIVYLSVSRFKDINLGSISYFNRDIDTRHKNIITASGVSKKRNGSNDIRDAEIVYGQVTNDNDSITALDLENTLNVYDGETKAIDSSGDRQLICTVLDDYTVVVPHDINSINGIFNLNDLTGVDLKSSSEANRVEEFSSSSLVSEVKNGGRNLYDVSSVNFENNIIDFKKKQRRRVLTDGASVSVTVIDDTASTFVEARLVSSDSIIFDESLNITKLEDLSIVSVSSGVGSATVSISTSVSLATVDSDGTDFLLDLDGNRFGITAVDTLLSTLTISTPAINNALATVPTLGFSEIVVKPTVTFASGTMTIDIPLDAGISSGDLIEIIYLTTLIPAIGTSLAIDYRFGFVFVDYAYLFDEVIVWYEYGDNAIDWSVSDSIEEGEEYFVTYKFGALRDSLRVNFGSLTNIPFFQSFGVDTSRELYRDAIKGVLQSFPKGPTIPAYKELVKSFTKIEPDVDELIFGNWILGRDYLSPGNISYDGVLKYAEGKFNDGLIFNDDITVSVPAISAISLDEGTVEAWVRPDWAGINNDATLTFNIDNIGEEKVFLDSGSDPFNSDNNWTLVPSSNLVGGSDSLGSGTNIFNYRSDSSEKYGLSVGVYGLYKAQENLDRLISSDFSATLRVGLVGSHFNDLRGVITNIESIALCEGEIPDETFFIVGCHGPGSFVGGPWPVDISSPPIAFNIGSLIIPDGERTSGISINLNEVSGFKFVVSPAVGNGGILSIDAEDIPKYNRPHYTAGCKCYVENTISQLEKFNDLSVTIELDSAFDFTSMKSSVNIIDDLSSVFILVDGEGIFYQVIGFYDNFDNLISNLIPDSAKKLSIKRLGINNPSLAAMGSEEINSALPTGVIRLLFKSVDVVTKSDYSNSAQAFGLIKSNVIDWNNYHEYGIVRTPCDNIVDIMIDGARSRMFYTDSFYSCNLSFGQTIDSEELRGVIIGMLGGRTLANIDILRGNGTLQNRYTLSDIQIGGGGFSPTRNSFSINRDDYPLTAVGEPPNASSGDGIFIWFDELCKSPVSSDIGQWIFRARSSRSLACPTDVILSGNDYTNVFSTFFPTHKFSGVITTDGEFSSVSRAFREESQGGCDLGVICNNSFRYCGNELLENFGWSKLEDSESDFINTIVGGRETQRGNWRKHGTFDTGTSTGIYRMGPSEDLMSCVEEDNFLGNLVYTENPCSGGNFEYIVSLRVSQVDLGISSGSSGSFSGAVSGNITGITPIHLNDGEIDIKIALAFSDSSQPLVLVIDSVTGQILDIISYIWNDQNFHEYKVEKDEESGIITVYVDNLLVSQLLLGELMTPVFDATSDFSSPNIAVYLFDSNLVDSLIFHSENIPNVIDIDLIFFSGIQVDGDGYLESNDILINTDSKIEFCFNIDDLDGYSSFVDGYTDAYDGYTDFIGVDEMFITSDRTRYLLDTGASISDKRFSIFKDGKGFLNFRIFDDSLSRAKPVGKFNLATSVKHFNPGELHHIAASWKLNSVDEKDEMHIFIDGQEAPNIFKFGGNVPVKLNDKFRDVSKEVLYDFLVYDVSFCDKYTDGTVSAGNSVFQSSSSAFSQDMIGRSILITGSTLAPTLIGGEYIIRSVIDDNQITLGRGSSVDLITFEISAGDIEFEFPPIAGIKSPILTDLRNSRLSIFRVTPDGVSSEMSGVFYSVSTGNVNIIKGSNVTKPKFRVNLDTRLIEFIGQDSLCNYIATIDYTDISLHIETYGLNLENCRSKLNLSSSSYISSQSSAATGIDVFSGQSVIKSRNVEPVSLEDVLITRTILGRTVIGILDPIQLPELGYQIDFDITFDNVNCVNNLSSESGAISKQNLGRTLMLFFDSDNVNYCEFDGYEDGYQDGSLGGGTNTITVYGTTTDGINEETFFIDKNGNIDGSKFFTSVTRMDGSLIVIDPDYFEAALIELKETDSVTISNNGGSSAEIFDYKNGHFVLTTAGSAGTFPFELHAGLYSMEYPAYLNLNLPSVGNQLHIGSDMNGDNQFGGVIDEFRIISEMSTDTRITESFTSGSRSVTDDFNKSIPNCPDSQTLTLIPFDNPIDLQSRRLRSSEFLDEVNNLKYRLSSSERSDLLMVVNDSSEFASKMINKGFDLAEANKTFTEVHKAEGGPIFNIADFYRNVEEFPKSDNSVNDSFLKSGNFTSGMGIRFLNNDGKFRKDEGTIEFWVSPAIDTFVDSEKRYYVDIFSAKRERVASRTSTVIDLPNAAGEIISVKLLNKNKEFSKFYDSSESSTILFDEVSRSNISGVLEGGTGTDKDFGLASRLSASGKTVFLSESLPGKNVDVIVTYVPLSSQGDRFSIFKNENNQIVFGITANGIDNLVSVDIDWKKNTWHRVMCTYRTGGSGFDTMRIFADGNEGGLILYGTGIIYGTGYIYGQYAQGDGQFRNQKFTIPLSDEFGMVVVGSDIFGDNSSRARMDNVRFSRVIRGVIKDSSGNAIDLNYSSNLNTVSQVVEDDATTLIINFDAEIKKIDRFATIIDPKSGIYNFDIEVFDNFDKVVGINDGEVEDLIVELVNRLKPAHTNALVKFTKNKC